MQTSKSSSSTLLSGQAFVRKCKTHPKFFTSLHHQTNLNNQIVQSGTRIVNHCFSPNQIYLTSHIIRFKKPLNCGVNDVLIYQQLTNLLHYLFLHMRILSVKS